MHKKVWKTEERFCTSLQNRVITRINTRMGKKLKRDIITLYKKDQRRRTTGATPRFGFIDIILVVGTVKVVFMILSW